MKWQLGSYRGYETILEILVKTMQESCDSHRVLSWGVGLPKPVKHLVVPYKGSIVVL